jgi:hypothetical protein
MTALATRMLRHVAAHPGGMAERRLLDAFPAYTERARVAAVERLYRAFLIAKVPGSDRYQVTALGESVVSGKQPPRWTERRA